MLLLVFFLLLLHSFPALAKDLQVRFNVTELSTNSTTTDPATGSSTSNTGSTTSISRTVFFQKLLHPRLRLQTILNEESRRLQTESNGIGAPMSISSGYSLSLSGKELGGGLNYLYSDRTSKIATATPNGTRTTSQSLAWSRKERLANLGFFSNTSSSKTFDLKGTSTGTNRSEGWFVNATQGPFRGSLTNTTTQSAIEGARLVTRAKLLQAGYTAPVYGNTYVTVNYQQVDSKSETGLKFQDNNMNVTLTAIPTRALHLTTTFTRRRGVTGIANQTQRTSGEDLNVQIRGEVRPGILMDLGYNVNRTSSLSTLGKLTSFLANFQSRPWRDVDLGIQYNLTSSSFSSGALVPIETELGVPTGAQVIVLAAPQRNETERISAILSWRPTGKFSTGLTRTLTTNRDLNTGTRSNEDNFTGTVTWIVDPRMNLSVNYVQRGHQDFPSGQRLKQTDITYNLFWRLSSRWQMTFRKAFVVATGSTNLRVPTRGMTVNYALPGEVRVSLGYSENFLTTETGAQIGTNILVPTLQSISNQTLLGSLSFPLKPGGDLNLFYQLAKFRSETLGKTENFGITYSQEF